MKEGKRGVLRKRCFSIYSALQLPSSTTMDYVKGWVPSKTNRIYLRKNLMLIKPYYPYSALPQSLSLECLEMESAANPLTLLSIDFSKTKVSESNVNLIIGTLVLYKKMFLGLLVRLFKFYLIFASVHINTTKNSVYKCHRCSVPHARTITTFLSDKDSVSRLCSRHDPAQYGDA